MVCPAEYRTLVPTYTDRTIGHQARAIVLQVRSGVHCADRDETVPGGEVLGNESAWSDSNSLLSGGRSLRRVIPHITTADPSREPGNGYGRAMEGNGAQLDNAAAKSTETTDMTDHDGPDSRPSRSDLHEVLSDRRRRYALYHLLQQADHTATKRELSTRIAAWESNGSVESVSAEDAQQVYIDLHRTHLPLMVDHHVVEFDTERDEVRLDEDVDELDDYLGKSQRSRVPWGQLYVLIGLVSVSWTVAGWAGLMPFAIFPGHVWAVVISLVVVGVGIVQTTVEGTVSGDETATL